MFEQNRESHRRGSDRLDQDPRDGEERSVEGDRRFGVVFCSRGEKPQEEKLKKGGGVEGLAGEILGTRKLLRFRRKKRQKRGYVNEEWRSRASGPYHFW